VTGDNGNEAIARLNIDPSLLLAAAAAVAGRQHHEPGTLYVLATPIGNLADLGLRTIDVLARVHAVACEDTRVAGALLSHLGLHKPLVPLHAHNERVACIAVLERLAAGESVAYVSDAGTPAVSDPGAALVAAAAAAGLATLAKGPLGLLLPGLVVAGYLVATREWRRLREILAPSALVAFLLVAAPWYAAVLADQGRHFLDVFILNHNLQRFSSTIHNHPGPFWYYLPLLLAGLFPWSGLAVPALVRAAPRASRADLFVLLWLALPLVFFSLAASKLPGYILPCVPPLAILVGRAADRLVAEGETPERRLSGRVVALVGLVLASLVAAGAPAALFRIGEPLWRSAIPLGVWAVVTAFLFSRRVRVDPAGALRVLRIGAAGLLLLAALAAPPILSRHESGRALFLPARGREVLAWGAWRTAWMAGYFYNDGRVRPVEGAREVLEAAAGGQALVLAGPGERRRLEAMGGIDVQPLATGPRQNALLLVKPRGVAGQ
jgi:hypothetical protein